MHTNRRESRLQHSHDEAVVRGCALIQFDAQQALDRSNQQRTKVALLALALDGRRLGQRRAAESRQPLLRTCHHIARHEAPALLGREGRGGAAIHVEARGRHARILLRDRTGALNRVGLIGIRKGSKVLDQLFQNALFDVQSKIPS